jgi:hypothetical protein
MMDNVDTVLTRVKIGAWPCKRRCFFGCASSPLIGKVFGDPARANVANLLLARATASTTLNIAVLAPMPSASGLFAKLGLSGVQNRHADRR